MAGMRRIVWLAWGKLHQLHPRRLWRRNLRGIVLAVRPTDKNDRATIRRTLHYFWGVTRQKMGAFVLSIVSSVGYIALLTFANTYVMGLIVDRVQASPVSADQVLPVFGPYVLALLVVNAMGQTLSKLQDYSVYKLEINGDYQLSRLCFDTLSNQSMTFHNSRFGGSLVSQTSRFVSGYSGLVDVVTYSLWPTLASIVLTVGILAPIAPLFVAILVVMLVLYVVIAYGMYRRILPLSAEASRAQNKLSGVLSDAVTNILAVKTYGREDYERGLFTTADREAMAAENVNMRATMRRGFTTSALITAIMFVVSIFVVGGNAWFGISAGTLVMMFTYTYNLTMRFNYFNSMMQRINRAFGDAAEMTRVLDEPTLVADDADAKPLAVTEGRIDFENLRFRYPDAPQDDYVFEDLNLHIPAGQRVGLVGRSGSGKTTLTKLLLRLDDVQEGRVLVDGQDVSHCTQQSLRRQVAYVPQEALLFHRSIRENIAYGKPDATEEEIRRAAEEANALEFIERLPDGFDTMVGERGVKLSGGQRQRVAIARAILVDAPILVLDEATSALDSESEALVQGALENLMRGRTSIVVAHRLSTVASLDRIVVLAHGEVVEDGTHHELVERGGEYASLWNRQTGGFLE
jgi:ATP-binding cassette subfamily B protein